MILAACSTVSSGRTVYAGDVISSAAVTACAFCSCWWRRMPVIMPGIPSSPLPRASFASRSDSETTPITWEAWSSTGNALTRCVRRAAAMTSNGVSSLTVITVGVMTSLTTAFIGPRLFAAGQHDLERAVAAELANTS